MLLMYSNTTGKKRIYKMFAKYIYIIQIEFNFAKFNRYCKFVVWRILLYIGYIYLYCQFFF